MRQYAEGQPGILPGGDHQVQAFGRMLQERRKQLMDRLLVDGVIVVQYQHKVAPQFVQIVDQDAGKDGHRGNGGAGQQRLRLCQRVGKDGLYSAREISQKHAEVIIVLVERQPGAGVFAGVQPGAQQGGLAEAGRRGNQDERAAQAAIQQFFQTRAMHQVGVHTRPIEFRA